METKTLAIILSVFTVFILSISGCATKTARDTVPANTSVQGGGQGQTIISNKDADASIPVIIIKNFAFTPAVLTVNKGTTVRWLNQDSASHIIKSDAINSLTLSQGQSFKFKFDESGTYDYICGIHTSMKGRIIVQ